jgi:Cys-tRNA(Pro)/Cys-tRNA(Cys) deacylase
MREYKKYMNPFSSPVTEYLQSKGIPFRLFHHPGPIHSLAQAAQERGQSRDQVVRSILFRLGEGKFAMVLVAGDRQVSWPVLRKHLGQSRLTLASQEEVLVSTGYQLGAVSPFGLPQPIPVLVDESVFNQDEISLGSGVRGTAVILKTADMLQALESYDKGKFT